MTSGKGPSNLEQFLGHVGTVERINALRTESSPKEGRVGRRTKADKDLRELAYKALVDLGVVDTSVVKSGRDLDDEEVSAGSELVNEPARKAAYDLYTGSLDSLVGGLSDKQLDRMTRIEGLEQAAGDKWGDWLKLYRTSAASSDLVERAKKKKLTGEEREGLSQGAVAAYTAEIKKKLDDKFKDNPYLAAVATQAATRLFARGAGKDKIDDYMVKGAEKVAKDAADKLKTHEKDKSQNVRGYVGAALGKFAKGTTEEANQGLGILYSIAKEK